MKHKVNEDSIMIRFMGLNLNLYLLLRNNHIVKRRNYSYFIFNYNNKLYDIYDI